MAHFKNIFDQRFCKEKIILKQARIVSLQTHERIGNLRDKPTSDLKQEKQGLVSI